MAQEIIGFIGTGVMGKGMIRNLMAAGFEVHVYNRTKEKAEELVKEGAVWEESSSALAAASDVVITIVGYPTDVREVYFGEGGVIASAKKDAILVDMTTSTPTLAKEIYEEARRVGKYAVDAPVSGGDIGAKKGTLSIMIGGDEETVRRLQAVFSAIGNNIVHQGGPGAGQHTKMCNQIAIASTMIGVTEAVVYAKKAGLDPEKVLASIESGAAGSWSLTNLVPRVLKEDYSPGFFIKHFIKDMGIALDEAERMNVQLPGVELAKKMYDALSENGHQNEGTQSLIKYWNL